MKPEPNHVIRFHSELIHGGVAAVGEGKKFDVPHYSNIIGNLWTGAKPPGVAPEYFKSILNFYPWEKYRVPAGTLYREIKMYDGDEVDEASVFDGAAWIADNMDRGPMLVHCQAGINRSNLVAATYLIRHLGMDPEDALTLIRERRSGLALANPMFVKWLRGG